jgi:hypothetical protein
MAIQGEYVVRWAKMAPLVTDMEAITVIAIYEMAALALQ